MRDSGGPGTSGASEAVQGFVLVVGSWGVMSLKQIPAVFLGSAEWGLLVPVLLAEASMSPCKGAMRSGSAGFFEGFGSFGCSAEQKRDARACKHCKLEAGDGERTWTAGRKVRRRLAGRRFDEGKLREFAMLCVLLRQVKGPRVPPLTHSGIRSGGALSREESQGS